MKEQTNANNRTTTMVLKNFPTLQKKNKKRNAQSDRQMTGNPTTTMVYRHGGQERQQLTAVTVAQPLFKIKN
jgi:hypothetical protein